MHNIKDGRKSGIPLENNKYRQKKLLGMVIGNPPLS